MLKSENKGKEVLCKGDLIKKSEIKKTDWIWKWSAQWQGSWNEVRSGETCQNLLQFKCLNQGRNAINKSGDTLEEMKCEEKTKSIMKRSETSKSDQDEKKCREVDRSLPSECSLKSQDFIPFPERKVGWMNRV